MKDTIDMARKAGFNLEQGFLLRVTGIDEDLKRFEALIRADERADCERVVGIALLGAEMDLAKRVLRAIRARGENT
jgi:hypothetical protein